MNSENTQGMHLLTDAIFQFSEQLLESEDDPRLALLKAYGILLTRMANICFDCAGEEPTMFLKVCELAVKSARAKPWVLGPDGQYQYQKRGN